MRTLALAALMSATMLSTTAQAEEDGLYAILRGGPSVVGDQGYELDSGQSLFETDGGLGGALAAGLGKDFGAYRLELEGAFYNQSVDDITIDPAGSAATALGVFGAQPSQGNRRAFTTMINGIVDIEAESPWTPFVGAGVGWGFVGNRDLRVAAGDVLDDNSNGPAVQVMAGVRREIAEAIDFGLQFRHTRVFAGDVTNAFGSQVDDNFNATSVLASLNFYFGRPDRAPEPAPIASPPPPPAAPMPAPVITPEPEPVAQPAPEPVVPGPFSVFFDWDSADITPEAADTIGFAAQAFKEYGQTEIILEGFADTSGAADYNSRLSARRAAAVKAQLETSGIDGDVISAEAFGEDQLRVNTLNNVREPQNRRVSITLKK
ncbi:MAG: OmpA family protein [Pseudomonadota bacterium]